MPRSRRSPRRARLQQLLIAARQAAGLTQAELALRLKRPQSFVSKYETGERRIDLVELLELADTMNFDAVDLLQRLRQTKN